MRNSTLILLMLAAAGCGSQGSTGATGATGTSAQILHKTHCFVLDSGSGTNLQLQYDSGTTSLGDRYVSCSVSTSNLMASFSTEYAASQSGATTGTCQVNLGLATNDFGFWTFTSQSGVSKAVYTDAASAQNGYTYTFTSGNCSVL
jgi:hypothetical protein